MTEAQIKRRDEAAEELAKRWIVLAQDKVIESLKDADDVPMILEVAFSDGYKTGHYAAAQDAEVLVDALDKAYSLAIKGSNQASIEVTCIIARALARYRGEGV